MELTSIQPRGARGERRREPRFSPAHASLSARLGTRAIDILDLSRHGIRLAVPPEFDVGVNAPLHVELLQAGTPIAALTLKLTSVTHAAGRTLCGGRIEQAQPLASGKPPLPCSGDVVELRDAEHRAAVLERIAKYGQPCTVQFESGATLSAHVGAAPNGPETLAFYSDSSEESAHAGQFVSLELGLFESRFVLETTLGRAFDGGFTLDPARRVLSLSRRISERVSLVPGSGSVEFSDLFEPGRSVVADVVDISPEGVGIELPPGALLPRAPIPLTLRIAEARVPVLAEAHRVLTEPGAPLRIGLKVQPIHASDRLRLARVCDRLRFPNLVQRKSVEPGAVLDLMRSSGYLELREGTEPLADWHVPPGDEALGVDSVFRADSGALLGHFSCARLYPKTWILHQLATVGLRRDRVAYPLYLQLLHWIATLSDGEGYALAYFNQERSWHQALFGSFVRWVGSEALSLSASLDRFEPASEPRAFVPSDVIANVRPAHPNELAFAVKLARSHLPPLLADALHIHEDSIATEDLCHEHTALGLERSRTTLVVEVQGELLGVALCETGAGRLSLFNILNMAHVFFREPVAPHLARAAQAALLRAVTEFYRARKSAQPLIVAPAGNAAFAAGAGLERAETMGAWCSSLGGIKQWRNYLHFSLGDLALRRRARDSRAA